MFTKRSTITFLIIISIFSVSAQGNNPTIAVNSVLNYLVSTSSGKLKLVIQIEGADEASIKMKWSSPRLANGRLSMKTQALQNGNHFFWGEPEKGVETKLEENETIACFSKRFYNELMQKGKAEFDFVLFLKKDAPRDKAYKLNGKEVDSVYIESEDGSVKAWLMNDENVPIVLKMEGSASGIDLLLESVE